MWSTCVTSMASGAQNGSEAFAEGEPSSFIMVNYGAFEDNTKSGNEVIPPVPSLSKPTKEERVSQYVLDAVSRD